LLPALILPAGRASVAFVVAALVIVAIVVLVRRRLTNEGTRTASLILVYLALLSAAFVAFREYSHPGPISVSTYSLFLVLGSGTAWLVLLRRLPKIGVPNPVTYAVLVGCFVFGLIGGKLAQSLEYALSRDHAAHSFGAGFGVFGALAADIVFLELLFSRLPNVSLLHTLDAGSSAIALNIGIARVGCLFAGCCFGSESPNIPGLTIDTAGRRVWATQPMEALLAFAIALIAEHLWRTRPRLPEGRIFGICVFIYGVGRFLLEELRADSPHFAASLTLWQFCCIACVGFAVALLMKQREKPLETK
jgi:phosphatidylglycerol:prolipoprotein diacylglycerol transferase